MHQRCFRLLWWTVLAMAAVLRLGRVVQRWDEIALAYAAYQAPVVDALADLVRLPTAFVGLHPPLYGVFFGLMEFCAPFPLLLLLFSGLCSWGAVWFTGRAARLLGGGWAMVGAGALAASGPVVLHYAAEINNYPLLLLLESALLWALVRYLDGRGGWGLLAALGAAALWTHLLGAVVAGIVALVVFYRHRGDGLRVMAWLALACLPLAAVAWQLTRDAHTFGQPPLLLVESLRDWRLRFGGLAIPMGLLALPSLRLRPAVAVLWMGLAASIVFMVAIGVAAPHQFPYWSLLMPMAAVLAGLTGARSRLWLAGVGLLVTLQMVVASQAIGSGLALLARDQGRERAIDQALVRAEPGDALWLISPALEPDDDKRAMSPVLWRLRPWRAMPMLRPFSFDYTDYRFGQPRRYGAIDIYTFTDFWPDRMDVILEHYLTTGHQVWIALYDHGPARDYPQRLHKTLRPWAYEEWPVGVDRGLGADLLLVVRGEAGSGGVGGAGE